MKRNIFLTKGKFQITNSKFRTIIVIWTLFFWNLAIS